jgi:hypothetical protein
VKLNKTLSEVKPSKTFVAVNVSETLSEVGLKLQFSVRAFPHV